MFCYFGIPEDIVSDRVPQNISRVRKAFMNVTVSLSSGYHSQSNGQLERRFRKWDASSEPSAITTRTLGASISTGPSTPPFQCVLCYRPLFFPWSGVLLDFLSVDHWFQERERVWDSAHHHLKGAIRRQKSQADVRRSAVPTYG